jgi:SAM-dependent methyltransferase
VNIVAWMDRTFFPGYEKSGADSLLHEWVPARLTPDAVVLDLGAGAGIVTQKNFRGLAAQIFGVDPEAQVGSNPFLEEGRVADAQSIPYPDAVFDVVFSHNILEHLERPAEVFGDVARVLKHDGVFLFKTPNKWHYMPLISRCTPHAFHRWISSKRGRAEEDTLPTLYRANSPGVVPCLAARTGFSVEQVALVEGHPEYLRIHPATYVAGPVYERLVNGLRFLKGLRVVLLDAVRKAQ